MSGTWRTFFRVHKDVDGRLEAMRVADVVSISPLARGYNDGTVASTIIRERATTEIKTDHRFGYKIRPV